MENIKIKKLHSNVKIPMRQTDGSVGYDLYYSPVGDYQVEILPGQTKQIGTGVAIELPRGYGAFLYPRSGLATRHGIVLKNTVGVIDSDYRGEIMVCLTNTSDQRFVINPDDRIAQMIISKCELPEFIICEELSDTVRDEGGFGSTG